jgi:two-component system chemotaxis sensor kinase CheA
VNLIFNWDRDLELDMDLLSDIRVCLLHVINNAVDHGVEDIVERTQVGKNPTALIHVGSIHSKDGLILIIEDDGRGLDRDRIERIGIKRGLITPEQKQIFSEHDIFDLIFYHGFSTKEEVTDLSGRGVGLSAVREICLQHGGNCKVISGPSGLTRFELHFVIQET